MDGLVAQATAVLKQAVLADNAGKAQEALKLYREGIPLLLNAAKAQSDPTAKASLNQRVEQYMSRAEALKSSIQKAEGKPAQATGPSPVKEETREAALTKGLKGLKARDQRSLVQVISTGCDLATSAIEADFTDHNSGKALGLYQEAIAAFLKGLKYCPDESLRTGTKEKLHQILERAEEIKAKLDSLHPPPSMWPTAKKGTSSPATLSPSSASLGPSGSSAPSDSLDFNFPSVPNRNLRSGSGSGGRGSGSGGVLFGEEALGEKASARDLIVKGTQSLEQGGVNEELGSIVEAIALYKTGVTYLELAVVMLEEEAVETGRQQDKLVQTVEMRILDYKGRIDELLAHGTR